MSQTQAEPVPHVFMLRSGDLYWCGEDQDLWQRRVLAEDKQGRVRFPTRSHAEARIRSMLKNLAESRQYCIENNDMDRVNRINQRILRWTAARVVCFSLVLQEIPDPS